MGEGLAHTKAGQSVISITKDGNRLKAVELRRHDVSLEVLWTKSSEADGDWSAFAVECGLATEAAKPTRTGRKNMVVAGFGSTGVAFYHIEAPAVGQEETEAIVKMQAENLLPLPAEQIEVAWRSRPSQDGKAGVTIAAARRDYLQRFVETVRGFDPRTILLNCEAIVKAWQVFFGGNEQKAAVVSLGAQNTQVCLAEDGQLTGAVVLDMGTEDLWGTAGRLPGWEDDGLLAEHTGAGDRFSQDMRSVLESFGCTDIAQVPVIVLSDGNSDIETAVSCLAAGGMNARAALPEAARVRGPAELKAEEIYEYRVPLGLAAMAVDGPSDGLRLFEKLYDATRLQKKKPALYSHTVAGLIAGAMLVVLVVTAYAVDIATEKRLSALASQAGFKEIEQRHTLLRAVAQQRPDLLELLGEISSGESKGIILDSIHFKKGQLATVSGQAQSTEQLYEFQKYLLGRNGIKEVNQRSAARGDKDKKLKFTLTFHYKNLTKKGAGL